MNNIQENLNNLVEILKDDKEHLEEMLFNGKKSKLHPADTMGEISFDNIRDFFLKNTGYDIEWIKSELVESGGRRKQKYDMDTLWQYCDFISYMMSFGASKNQSINLLKEVVAEKSTTFGFNSDMSYNFMDFDNFNGKREFKGFNDILAFTNLAISITKNHNIENSIGEKAFDETLKLYKKIWNEFAMKLSSISENDYIAFDNEFPKNKVTSIVRKNYKDSLDLLVALQGLDEKSKEIYSLFIKRLITS
tara:strand:+ start:37 stop:783 length:747 start_codon:yes stop_codon:yes gene_type:complete